MIRRFSLATALLVTVLSAGTASAVDETEFFDFTYSNAGTGVFATGNLTGFEADGSPLGVETYEAVGGSITISGSGVGIYAGTYSIDPAGFNGGASIVSPSGLFITDNTIYENFDAPGSAGAFLTQFGLLFSGGGIEVNMWGNGPGNYSLYVGAGGGYPVADNGGIATLTESVPEPATLTLFGLGALGLSLAAFRRRKLALAA